MDFIVLRLIDGEQCRARSRHRDFKSSVHTWHFLTSIRCPSAIFGNIIASKGDAVSRRDSWCDETDKFCFGK